MVELAPVFRALSDPNRLAIYRLIREREDKRVADMDRSISVLAREFDLSLSTVSHHIKELRQDGLLRGSPCSDRSDRAVPRRGAEMIFSRAERREKEVVTMSTQDLNADEQLRKWARKRVKLYRRLEIRVATFALGMLILTPVWAVGEYLSSGGWPQRLSANDNPGDWAYVRSVAGSRTAAVVRRGCADSGIGEPGVLGFSCNSTKGSVWRTT